MSEQEFAAWLRERRGAVTHEDCVKIEKRIEAVEHQHDVERGEWVGNQIVHHEYGESRQ